MKLYCVMDWYHSIAAFSEKTKASTWLVTHCFELDAIYRQRGSSLQLQLF